VSFESGTEPSPRQPIAGSLHRYCSGCSRETEHASWLEGEALNIPTIRWAAAVPTVGTTVCVDCGEWRVAAAQPLDTTWSEWPRRPATTNRS
jgi:hypothetical protein